MGETKTLSKQYLSDIGASIDAAVAPVETYSGLSTLDMKARYVGMEKIVLNKGATQSYPMKFFLSGNTINRSWTIKEIFPISTLAELNNLATFVKEQGMPISKFSIGLKATVVADETNDNKPTEYKVTAIDSTNNVITWERCETVVSIDGDDLEAETTETQE